MRISGFTFMRNTSKLYYPYIESILSIIDLVDEMIIAMGDNDEDDLTRQTILDLRHPKIKIIDTKWDIREFPDGMVYAQQTDVAKNACTGDWLLYLQSDEIIHEEDHSAIKDFCLQYLEQIEVEGFLFSYRHFWGDYDHLADQHGWYPREIRIIRNRPDIHSFGDAQSFRSFLFFDEINYRPKEGTRKLQVKKIPAHIYHYGWVRPPSMMLTKTKVMDSYYHEGKSLEEKHSYKWTHFDYGNMTKMTRYKGKHPKVMQEFMSKMNWQNELHFEKDYLPIREKLKHEKLYIRMLSFIERIFNKGLPLFGYNNWKIIK